MNKAPLLTEEERQLAMQNIIAIVKQNLPKYTYKCQKSSSEHGLYPEVGNNEWTSGFWPGLIWLSYENSGDELFKEVGLIFVQSFKNRIVNQIAVDHHDMGFLYTPSCVSAYRLTESAEAKEAALLAADKLITRFHKKGEFIQAWGPLGDKDSYRYIIDCLLNLPLLYWASEVTKNPKYREIALKHTATCLKNSFREDFSTYHTFFMNAEDGSPVRGETCQGYKADSSWARGQAWGIYGLALSYRYTKELKYLDLFEKVSQYFLSRLPEDLIPYWDLIFTSGKEPRDSSSSSIVACGFLEAAMHYEKLNQYEKSIKYKRLAKQLLKALFDNNYLVSPNDNSCNGIVKHGVYSKKSPYNTCTPEGVDECVSWGDYFFAEALTRLGGEWKCYW